MNKLTSVESQRIMAVMGDLLDRLNYLTYIPLEPEKDLVNMLRDNRCVNSAEILNEQWRWEQLHAQAVDGLDHRKEDIADQVRMNARALCRELRENAVAVEVLLHTMSNGHERSDDLLMFLKSLSELTDLTQSQLEKSLEDAKSKKELMHLAESRMKQAEDDRVSIREKLSELRKTKEEEISLLDSQVEKLKSELQNLNQSAAHELGMIEAELKDVQAKAHEAYTQEIKVLLDKAHALQAQTDKMAIEHREEEELLRKRKCKAATEVANIVEKYDKEMAAIENEIKELEFSYQTELTKCNELQEYFLKIDEEQARIDAEERVVEEIRAKEREKEMFLISCAIKIQKRWRGFVCRRELEKLTSKTKKSGKKGKKK